MTRRDRIRYAAVSVLPTLLTVPLCAALAAAGILPWSGPPAVAAALVLQGVVAYLRFPSRFTSLPPGGSAPRR